MRNFFLFVFLLGTGIQAHAGDDGFSISVKIKGYADKELYLGNHYGDKQYITDTAQVQGGEATFKGKTALKNGIYLIITKSKKYFEILITEKDQRMSLETDSTDFVGQMRLKGSEENKRFYDYLSFINKKGSDVERWRGLANSKTAPTDSIALAKKNLNALDEEVKAYKTNVIKTQPGSFLTTIFKASQEPEVPPAPTLPNGRKDSTFQYRYLHNHFWDTFDFTNEGLLRTPIFYNKIKTYTENLSYPVPDSISASCRKIINRAKVNKEMFKYCVIQLTSTYEKSNIMGMDAVFVDLVDAYYRTKQAFWVDSVTQFKILDRASKLKPLLIGKIAPNLTLRDTAGVFQTLYNVNSAFTLLVFWDPDCSHCKKEIPALKKEYQEKLKAKGVSVFAVCTETERKKWLEFIRKEQLDWINVADIELQNTFRSVYDVTSTPVVYLLNKNKRIEAKRLPVEKIPEFIEFMQKRDGYGDTLAHPT
jgi:peroxiredoxin